jgi:3-hydroxyisobutyrate dehydrogenase-like beta-hydroxyacid dehydrogenase
MAQNILKKGYTLTVYNRSRSKAEPLAELGAHVAASPQACAEASDVTFICVSYPEDVEAVVAGPQGALEGAASSGSILVDCSTIGPAMTRSLSQRCSEAGVSFLDAPVTGGTLGAEEARLIFMVGGDREAFERARPVIETMGKDIFYMGPSGAGAVMKLIVNQQWAAYTQVLAEGITLGTKAGLAPEAIVEVLAVMTGGKGLIAWKGPKIIRGDYSATFRLHHMHKDVALTHELAEALAVPVPVTSATLTQYIAARAAGLDEADFTALLAVMEQLANCPVRSKD